MKITGSSVSLDSEHRISEYDSTEKFQVLTRNGNRAMELIASYSSEEKSSAALLRDFQREEKLSDEQRQKENQQNSLRSLLERMNEAKNQPTFDLVPEEDLQISLLRKLLAALNGKSHFDLSDLNRIENRTVCDIRSSAFKKADMIMKIKGSDYSAASSGTSEGEVGTTVSGTTWQRITAVSGVHNESEYTTFASKGLALTEDGRRIDFNVELSMSRSFTAKLESISCETVQLLTDPLIINIDNKYTGLSDVKFKFDLDCDGKQDEISFAGQGSGFLALDKDGNGKIDDGSELFGTQSGDGFADLAAYDEDGNSWIDENDEIFSRLRVWTKDSEGNDKLLNLKEANVGAIYLGSAKTEFQLKDGSNSLNGAIRKTGIYLKETGEVGTIQHVDLAM